MEAIHTLEIAVTLWLQSLGTFLIEPMRLISFFGTEEFYLLLMPMLYWCVDASLGLRMGIMLLLAQVSNSFFKLALRQPRPYWTDARVQAFAQETSFGLPSGHSQSSAGIWGLLAISLRKRWLTIVTLVMIFLIGLSRIYLGVHFMSDVLLGWLLGGLLVWLFARLDRRISGRVARLSLGKQVLLVAATSLLIVLLPLSAAGLASEWIMPSDWASNAANSAGQVSFDPLNIDNAFTIAGTWFGMLGGAAYLWKKRGKFNAGGPAAHRLLRYLIGLVGVMVLWYGLGALFPRNADVLSYALRYLRYTLLGSWVSLFAPLLYQRIGIGGFITPAPRKERKRDRIERQVA